MKLLSRGLQSGISAAGIQSAIVAGAALLLIAVWTAAMVFADHHRQEHLEETKASTASLATAFEEHVVRTVNDVDRLVQRVKQEVEARGNGRTSELLVAEHKRQAGLIAVITVADASGNIVASSLPSAPTSIADREHFRIHVESDSGKLFISKPILGRVSGRWSLQLTRRINKPDGSFGGVVGAAIDLDYFQHFYHEVGLGVESYIAILGRDGVLRVRHSAAGTVAGQDVGAKSHSLARIRDGEMRGSLVVASPVDGERRVMSYRALKDYPLVVLVAVSESAVLARAAASLPGYYLGAGAFTGTIALMSLALLLLFARERRGTAALRASEARFRAFTRLGSDWYCETDPEYRITVMSEGVARASGRDDKRRQYLGEIPWNLEFLTPVNTTWDEHRELITQRRPFRDLVLNDAGHDGVRYVRVSGEPVYDEAGEFTGYRAVGHDITAETRLQRRLRLQHEVTRILAAEAAPSDAITRVLETACRTLDWQWGARRGIDRATNTMMCLESWCAPDIEQSDFVRVTRAAGFALRSGGFIASVLASGEPRWHADATTDHQWQRRQFAHAAGLRAALAVPIVHGGQTDTALEFFSRRVEQPDEDLVETFRSIGREVGQFLARMQDAAERRAAVQAQAQLAAIVEASSDAIVGRSLDGTIISWNAAAERMLGYTAAEAIGQPEDMILLPERRHRIAENNERLLRGETVTSFERKRAAKDGRVIDVYVGISPLRDAKGAVVGASVILRDITELKQAQAERARLAAIIESSNDAIIGRTLDGTVTSWNAGAERLLGYSAVEMIGRPIAAILPPERQGVVARNTECLLRGEAVPPHEGKDVARDGRLVDVFISISPIKDNSGKVTGASVILHDISALKRAENALRESEERLTLAIEGSGLATFDWDIRSGTVLLSELWNEMLGGERHPVLTTFEDLVELTHPEERAALRAQVAAALKSETPDYRAVHRVRNRAGAWRWIQSHGKVVARDADGRATRFIGTNSDVTARVEMEQALRESEERYRDLFEANPTPMWVRDSKTLRFLAVNEAMVRTYGYSREELFDMTVADLRLPEDVPRYLEILRNTDPMAERHALARHRRKDGSIFHAEITTRPLRFGNGYARLTLAHDVSERLNAERALRESEARFRAAFEQAAVGILRVGLDNRYLQVNRKFCDIVGYPAEELIGRPASMLSHPEETAMGARLREQVLDGRIGSFSQEKRYIRKDGTPIWVNRTESLVRDEAGNPSYFIRVIEDITERRRLEAKIEQTFEQAAVGIARLDFDRNVLSVNTRFCEMLGYERDEMLRLNLRKLSHPDDLGMHAEPRARLVAGELRSYTCDKRYIRKDGRTLWTRRTASVARDELGNPEHYIYLIEDITEHKRAEEDLRRKNALTSWLESLAAAANEARDPEDAMRVCLARICDYTGWPVGHGVIFDGRPEDGRAQVSLWELSDAQRWHEFRQASDAFRYSARDGGFIASVLQSRQARWVEDLTGTEKFHRSEAAAACGIRSGFALPVTVGERVVAFFEFYSDAREPVDESLLQVVRTIAAQLGRVVERREAENALRASEERFRLQFEYMPVACMIRDSDFRITAWNPAAERIFGYRAEEALGARAIDLVVPDEVRPGIEAIYEKLRHGVASSQQINECVTKDGRRIACEWYSTPIFGAAGVFIGSLAMVMDVTERIRAERELRESEERFRQLATNIPQVFWMSDAVQHTTLYVSPAVETLIGQPVRALISDRRKLIRSVHRDDRRRLYAARKAALNGGYDEFYRIVRPDGSVRWVRDRAFPVRDARGEVYRIAGIAEDITEKRQAEIALRESEERLRTITDNVPVLISYVDAGERYRFANRTYEEWFGIPCSAYRGRTVQEIFGERAYAAIRPYIVSALHGTELTVERRTRTREGERFIRVTYIPHFGEQREVLGFYVLGYDLTDVRRAEEEVRKINAELEQRVAHRTTELEAANRELEAFAYSVSHDLRAPLRTIDGFSQMVLEESAGTLGPVAEGYLQRVRAGSQRMAQLIDDLLELSRIARSDLSSRSIDLSAMAQGLAGELQAEEPGRDVAFSVEPGITVEADPNLLRIALDNLLRNAWKFTGKRERAVIEIGCERNGEEVRIFVRDNGVGFDMRYASKLFGPFQRLHSDAEFRGTGIGLAIVQRVVRRHGGDVWAEAAPGRGATFRFTVRASRASAAPADPEIQEA